MMIWTDSVSVAGSRPIASQAATQQVAALDEPLERPAPGSRRSSSRRRSGRPGATRAVPARRARSFGPPGTDRPGLHDGAIEPVRRRIQGHARRGPRLVAEQRPEHPDRRLVAIEPLAERRQVDAERLVLADVPAGPETQDVPAAGQVVERDRLLGEDRRMAERGGQHGLPDRLARHVMRQRGERRHRLERRPAAVSDRVHQVVVQPARIEHLVLARLRPGRVEARPVRVLRRGPEADPHRAFDRASIPIRKPVPLADERQEPRPALVRRRHRAGTCRARQRRRLAARQPLPDLRAEVGHERDARPAAAHRVGDAIRRPPDMRHPVEREADVAAPRVVDPPARELRVDTKAARR